MHFLILFEAEEDATLAARAEGGPAGLVSEPVSTKRTHFFFYLCIHFWPEDHMTATGFKSQVQWNSTGEGRNPRWRFIPCCSS